VSGVARIAQAFDDRGVLHDAQPIPAPPPRWPKRDTRGRGAVWIRIGGRWLPGHVQRWYRLPRGGWGCWVTYHADPEHPTVAPEWGHYAYDPETILDRRQWPQPPAES